MIARLRVFALVTAGVLLVSGLAALVTLMSWSTPGQPPPYLDATGATIAGSLSEKVFVELNGVKQGMIIRSRDVNRPVLLFVHGGMPEYFLERRYPSRLDELFTVVWWEQRGSGLSYVAGAEPITSDRLISDTIELSRLLCRRFGKEKLYLMGHSGGSFIALRAAARAPELFHAYLGVAQMVNQLESEELAREWMRERYREQGNTAMVQRLNQPVTSSAYLRVRDQAMHELGVGTMRNMKSVFTGIVLQSLQCRDYTLAEKLQLWRGKAASGVSTVWSEMLAADLKSLVPSLQVPAYFFHGVHDRTCSYELASDYASQLTAPAKKFYSFEGSAHSPMFEEPERMLRILEEDVLADAT